MRFNDTCRFCGKKERENEIFNYNACGDCTDVLLHQPELMLDFINENSTLESEFFVNTCFAANDIENSYPLMCVCRREVTPYIKDMLNPYFDILINYIFQNFLDEYFTFCETEKKEVKK